MKTLFQNTNILDENFNSVSGVNLLIDADKISYIGKETKPADRVINGEKLLLIPALYNTHSHLPMSLLKGYAEDMALQDWLFNNIFPAEEKLTGEAVYYASMLSIAEMIKNGVVSCTDMYYFCDDIIRAADESGIKCNISRAVQSFDINENPKDNPRFIEAKNIHKNYHNYAGGRIKIDMSIHAEYTSNINIVRAVGEYAAANRLATHIHLSETKSEHEECIRRHNMTPCEYFNSAGFFETPSTAAHCVYVTAGDMRIMSEKNVTAAHCPVSNLKLSSGVADIPAMLDAGVNVTIGTDGSASNNNLDVLKEMNLCSLLQKGIKGDPRLMPASSIAALATKNSARAQGRADCGILKEGYKADITAFNLNSIETAPVYDYNNALLYSLRSANVAMTICDGKILYENGTFTTIDIEKVIYNVNRLSEALYKNNKDS